jgi:uncharacterized protein YecT (DUF1311 family)
MRTIIAFIFIFFSHLSFSQTQTEINNKANFEFAKSDKLLNKIYRDILTEYKSDIVFIEKLRKAQSLWIQFRDAQVEMKYPEGDDQNNGSLYPMCKVLYLKELTDQRIATLQEWLNGNQEGDVCNGSVNKP